MHKSKDQYFITDEIKKQLGSNQATLQSHLSQNMLGVFKGSVAELRALGTPLIRTLLQSTH